MLITGSARKTINSVKVTLSKNFEMKVLREAKKLSWKGNILSSK